MGENGETAQKKAQKPIPSPWYLVIEQYYSDVSFHSISGVAD